MSSQNFNDLHPRNRKGEFTDKPGTEPATETDVDLAPAVPDWEAQADHYDKIAKDSYVRLSDQEGQH